MPRRLCWALTVCVLTAPVLAAAGMDVSVAKDDAGVWELRVGTQPYIVKGMEYAPVPAGSYPVGFNEWMHEDMDGNGKIDAPYDSWVDKNADNFRDSDEDAVGDFQLLKDMGCNTIRIYHSENLNVPLLRDLYATYGVRVIMGNFVGAYTICSGAEWCDGTDYTDPQQCANMKESVRAMVAENKDEPYLLMYMLGNENDAEGSTENSTKNNTNAAREPEAYARFINDLCLMIKEMDPHHPVGVCLSTYKLLPYFARYAPAIDIIGMNSYAGPYGFGALWHRVRTSFDRPVLISEYGVDCWDCRSGDLDEAFQSQYHRKNWRDIVANSAWGEREGNAIGGVVFCWMDKWWLCGSHRVHDTDLGAWRGPTKDGFYHDEWLGVCGQGNGTYAPFLRQPRAVYYLYKDQLWNAPFPEPEKRTVPSSELQEPVADERPSPGVDAVVVSSTAVEAMPVDVPQGGTQPDASIHP